jgi:hypothetical protein
MINTKAEITEWIAEARTVESAELPMPATLIRALMAQSVKALEMLAKDAGMLADSVKVSGGIEIRINGVNLDDLT